MTRWKIHLGSTVFFLLYVTLAFADQPSRSPGVVPSQTGYPVQRRTQAVEDLTSFPHAEGRILVKFRDRVSESAIPLAHPGIEATSIKRYNIVKNLHLVRLPAEVSVQKAIESYRKNPDVLYAEPDYIVKAYKAPNDPFFNTYQWNLHNTGQKGGTPGADIKALEAWDITTGSKDVVAAVIDTGIDYTHTDLSANIWRNEADCNDNSIDDDGNGYIDDCHGIDTLNYDSDPMDDNNHGTHLAGIIGAVGNNGLLVAGINWNVSIMACKFLDATGYGPTSGAIACLEYIKTMKERGVNIIATNNSWGGGGFSQALFEAIDAHWEQGILFVAAAGNVSESNDAYPDFPASYYLPNIISVAATDRFDDLAFYSNEGRHTVHLGAPGSQILSTTAGNVYNIYSGTSMATPHVTGVAALLKAQDPSRDWKAIRNLILAGGDTLPSLSNTITQKRLNAYGSLTCSNSILLSRLWPIGKAVLGQVGAPLQLSVLHINCAVPNGEIDVIVNPGAQIVTLRDDGLGQDQEAGDGIYSGQWTPSEAGVFSLTFPNDDVVAVRVFAGQNVALFRGPVYHLLGRAGAEGVAIGDFNGDGRNDVVVITSNYNDPENDQRIHVFLQNASGELEPHGKYLVGDYGFNSETVSVDIGDLNNDGKLDIAVTSHHALYVEENFVGLFLQNESGTFDPMVRHPTLSSSRLKIGDVNSDGLADIVSISFRKDTVMVDIFLQNRTGTLDPPVTYELPFDLVHDVDLEIADMNNDGLNDVVIVSGLWGIWSTGPTIAILYQQLDGTLGLPVYLPTGLMGFVWGIAVGDINNDGLQDIVFTHGGNSYSLPKPYVGTFLQDTSGEFLPAVNYPSLDGPGNVRIADIDSDGRNDVIAVVEGTSLAVFFQAPNGYLFPHLTYWLGDNPRKLAIGDVNGDGRKDIVAAMSQSGLVVFYNDPQPPQTSRLLWALKGGNGDGSIISSPSGINCGTTCQADYDSGTHVTLTAVAAPGSVFVGWWDNYCGSRVDTKGACTVVMTLNWAPQANFDLKSVRLTVSKSGAGNGAVTSAPPGINCGTDCTEDYPSHTQVLLTATPKEGSVFAGWTGGPSIACPGTDPCWAIMESDTSVTARFDLKAVALTVNKAGTGSGTVTSSPGGINCDPDCSEGFPVDTEVTLTALADPGSTFAHWSGGCSGKGLCVLKMDAAKAVTAIFITPLRISALALGDGEVGVPYEASLGISGGFPPYTVSISRGSLPEGLGVNGDGVLVGIPSWAGNSSLTVQVFDALGSSVERDLKIKIFKALSIATNALKSGKAGKNYSSTLKAKGGKKPYTWSLVSGSLPEGLALNGLTGKIAGVAVASGSFGLTVQVTDVFGGTNRKDFVLVITP